MQKLGIDKLIYLLFTITTFIVFVSAWFIWYRNDLNRLEVLSRELVNEQYEMFLNTNANYSNDLIIISSHRQLRKLKNLDSNEEKNTIIDILFEEVKPILDLKYDYDQFRVLERSGMEILRIDRVDSIGIRTPEKSLQNKSDRYYFKDIVKVKESKIYYSPLDLSVEHGELEIPYKPTIRYALPLNAPDSDFFLILNINYSKPLAHFQRMNKHVEFDSFLLNQEGYYLSSPNESQEWGFMIEERNDQRIQSYIPGIWKDIDQNDLGIIHEGHHIYVWRNIYLNDHDLRWTILTEITPANSQLVKYTIPAFFLLFLFINTVFIFVMNNHFRKKLKIKNIVEQKKILEIDLIEKKNMLRKAVYLQNSFIQKENPKIINFNIHNLFMPCEKLGGDFFSIIKRKNNEKLIIVMGDCTDHGMKASMDASLLSRIIEQNIEKLYENDRTDLFLNHISKKYMETADDDQFPTMLVLIINIIKGEMFYSNANSALPYVIRDNTLMRLTAVKGFHLGYFEDPEYERRHFVFEDDDRLFLFSDAVIDIEKKNKSRLGYEGLEKILRENRGNAKFYFKKILDKLKIENGKFPLEDDTTLILLEYKKMKEKLYHFQTLEEWKTVHNEIQIFIEEFDYSEDEIIKVCETLNEIFNNSYLQGNKNDNSRSVLIKIHINCKEINIEVEDDFIHELGAQKLKNNLDKINYSKKGNKITLIKYKGQRKSSIVLM